MKNLLDSALCMIDDRHIEEAATYAPQAKTISFRKILPLAVCFVLVVVSAFAVKNYFAPDVIQTTTDNFVAPDSPYTTVAGVTDESTTGADVPPANITTESTTSAGITKIRLFCTTPMKDYTGWENIPFDGFYHCINIGDDYYYAAYVSDPDAYTDEPLAKEKLGKLLYEFNRSDYRFEINGSSDFTVEVYEINGYSKEEAVAVGRKDGLMKGYYAYYRTTNEE